MMKLLRQVLGVCALVGGLCGLGISPAQAAAGLATPKTLEQDKVCTACHDASWDKPILTVYQQRHGVKADGRTPGCQSCHGQSADHLKSPSNAPERTFTAKSKNTAAEKNEACQSCHKGGNRIQWEGSTHANNDVACASCHDIHRPQQRVLSKPTQPEVCYNCHKPQRAEFNKTTHMPLREGKMACSDCHNPHGSTGPKLLTKNSVTETCTSCHAEKRGPFLFEHPPAADSCTNCHAQHGSNHRPLLKARLPMLCQQCHDFTQHPGNPYSGTGLPAALGGNAANAAGNSGAQQLLLRSCANCHSQVHGTNHPSGARLTR